MVVRGWEMTNLLAAPPSKREREAFSILKCFEDAGVGWGWGAHLVPLGFKSAKVKTLGHGRVICLLVRVLASLVWVPGPAGTPSWW